MPLSSTTTTGELWSPVTNKTTGQVYKNIEQCNDVDRFTDENTELSTLLDEKLQVWLKADPGNPDKFTQFKEGFSYKHTDGYTYKMVKYNNQLRLSRVKTWTGGAGGGARRAFTYMRTTEFKVGRVEDVASIINNQGPDDSWRITYMSTDAKGDKFMMENLRQYTPGAAASSSSSSSEEKKETGNESESETEEENADN